MYTGSRIWSSIHSLMAVCVTRARSVGEIPPTPPHMATDFLIGPAELAPAGSALSVLGIGCWSPRVCFLNSIKSWRLSSHMDPTVATCAAFCAAKATNCLCADKTAAASESQFLFPLLQFFARLLGASRRSRASGLHTVRAECTLAT